VRSNKSIPSIRVLRSGKPLQSAEVFLTKHVRSGLGAQIPARAYLACPIRPKEFPLFRYIAAMLCFYASFNCPKGASLMEWVTPQHEEIDLNCEISSYANAEL
jgi:hypothetical protein